MNLIEILLLLLGVLIIAPIVSYLVMKFGVVGYLRGRNRNHNKKSKHEN